jgi:signal transduction histidine kinase
MRYFLLILLLGLWLPAPGQPVLTITNARKANPIATYARYLVDTSHKLTYEQVAQFPSDSFQGFNHPEVVQLGYPQGSVWIKFSVENHTQADLYLISSFTPFKQLDVFVEDNRRNSRHVQAGQDRPFFAQAIPTATPVILLGATPQTVYMRILVQGHGYGDYLHLGDVGQAIRYNRDNSRWQALALGVYLVVFVFGLVLFVRLKESLIGWYTLLMASIILFYVEFYGYIDDYSSFGYLQWPAFLYQSCWSIFHIKFLNLKHYSKGLYWSIIGANLLFWFSFLIDNISNLVTGVRHHPLGMVLEWLGLDWGVYILVVLFLLLISLIYVALKDFKAIRGYSLAFLISLAGMIISMFALYGFEWIPFLPYNNTFVPATLIEILILGYILADRANQHRLQQHQMQHQLIIQLQENLRQRDKLLHIRDEIARDLHDQVGATLTSIAISTKLVQKKVGLQQTDIEPILAQIKADSEDTILNIRDTVWALNPDNDAPEKFLERLRTVACQLLANQGITLTFDNEVELEALPPFSMEQRRNLFLVYKEALHNIVKHAQASKVSIQIRHLEGHLQVTVSDNGYGFDPAAQTDGNGLINFQKRANEGGFSVWVTSAEGAGTTVKMQIPVLELADQAFYASELTKLQLGRIPP